MRNPRFDKLKILYPRKVGDIGKLKRLGEQVSRGFFIGKSIHYFLYYHESFSEFIDYQYKLNRQRRKIYHISE